MFENFFCCSVCLKPITYSEFKKSPLRICELCSNSFHSHGVVQKRGGLTVFSLYESGNFSWPIFKSWKKRPSLETTNWFLKNAEGALLDFLQNRSFSFADTGTPESKNEPPSPITFIPLPQSSKRRWRLLGGSVYHWTDALQKHLRTKDFKVEVVENLLRLKKDFFVSNSRQAEKSRQDRLLSENPFYLQKKRSPTYYTNKMYLLDDFFTTGTTLQWAYQTLRDGGLEVHGSVVLAKRTM